MDGLTLLTEAWAAGLSVHADGARLVIRGPKSADAVARRLLAHKAVVLPALTGGNGNTTPPNPEKNGGSVDVDGPCPWDEATDPGPPCRVCGSVEHWQDAMGGGHCQRCEVETLDKALKLTERAAGCGRKPNSGRRPTRIAPVAWEEVGSIFWTSKARGPYKRC